MRKQICSVVLAVLVLLPVVSGQSIDELKKCVAFVFGRVHVKGPNGEIVKDQAGHPVLLEMPLGTAFFVAYLDKRGGDDYNFVYAVTAKHVLKDVDGTYLKTVRLRLNLLKPENGSSFAFADVQVADDDGRLLWLEDKEDPQNDIAAVPLLPDIKRADFDSLSITMFSDAALLKERNITEGDSVYLFGLMPQYYGEKKNYPVVRKGSLALLTEEAIKTGPDTRQHAYLAELGSWPGNSGAPVFLNFSGVRNGLIYNQSSFYLLGLMLGYFSNMREAETVDTRTIAGGDPSNIGISFILPASTIRRILDSPTAIERRDSEIKALQKH